MVLNHAKTQSAQHCNRANGANGTYWTIQSSVKRLDRFLIAMASLGAVLIFLARGRVHESSNVLSAYWVGILLAAISIGVFLFFENTLIRVDPSIRSLVILKKGRFAKRSYLIPFDQVASVNVASIGKWNSGVVTYHLVIRLKNNKREAPGYFSKNQNEVIEVAQRLASDVGCECIVGRRDYPLRMNRFVLSAVGAVLFYVLWYRVKVGPWCPAMWYGSAPPILMAFSFFALMRIFRRFP